MKVQPMITVRDVEASSRWYQELLGCESGHGGPEYEMLLKDGELLLQLHHWHDHEHPNMGDPDAAPHGYGVLLWFETAAFGAAVARARALGANFLKEPHVNPLAQHLECWMRDPDGYTIVLASPYGDVVYPSDQG